MGLFAAGGRQKRENAKHGNGKKTKTRKRRKLDNGENAIYSVVR